MEFLNASEKIGTAVGKMLTATCLALKLVIFEFSDVS